MARSLFGSIDYLGPDRYRIRWTDDGKRRSKTVHGTRDDAEAVLAAAMLRRGRVEDMPWRSFWAAAVTPTFDGLAEKTVSGYERVWRVELEPRIGSRMVGATTWRQVEAVLGDIRATSVQRSAMRLWRKMCNLAVRDGLLDRNPVDRSIRLAPHVKRRKTLIGADEVAPWMEAVRGIKYEPVFLLEVGGGLRHEEACAMVWENMERFEAYGRAYVAAKIERGLVMVDGRKVLKGVKNEFSVREVVLGEPFASRLVELHAGNGPVCPSSWPRIEPPYTERSFASPSTITHNWRTWCGKHGMPYVRPGDMRSVFATLHGEAGTPDSLVSMAMGHADGGSTKARSYQQRTRRGMIVAADSLTDYLDESATGREQEEFRRSDGVSQRPSNP